MHQTHRKLRAERDAMRSYSARRDAHAAAARQTATRLEAIEEVQAALRRCVAGAKAVRHAQLSS